MQSAFTKNMAAITNAVAHSETSSEGTIETTSPYRFCKAFSNPAGNVVFKTSDNVIFLVEDFCLKGARLVRDQLLNTGMGPD